MKIFCSISTAGRSLLPAALFGAVLISLAAAVLVFQMRREKWLQALNTTAFLLLFVLLNVVFSKIDRQGDTQGSIDLLTGLLWIIIAPLRLRECLRYCCSANKREKLSEGIP